MSIEITVGRMRFLARLETERAPKTCARFTSMLPLKTKIIQARWSGESAWIPFGELDLDLGYENHTSYPAPGHLLLYPGGISETEILFPYGSTVFALHVADGSEMLADWADGPKLTITVGERS